MKQKVTIDDVISKYMWLRAKKEAIDAEYKEKINGIKEKMSKLEAYLLARMNADGVKSFKSEHGTAYVTTVDFATVDNWDAVLTFIKEHDAYDMLEKRVSKAAVRSYLEAHREVPPGVKYGTRLTVNVRKS